jgi:hypothetical protein
MMASVRRLARGGASVQVSDTELSLLRSAVAVTAGGSQIDLEGVDESDRALINEALQLRAQALQELAAGLARVEDE